MRALLLGLAGLMGGAVIGLTAAFVLVYLWFDVLHLPSPSDDPKPGLSMLAIAGPVLMLVGGIAAGTWLIRRDRAGKGPAAAVLFAALGLVLLIPVAMLLGN